MYLAQLLRSNPILSLAFLVCLATILWCILLTRRQHIGLDKMLTGLLGLITCYQALRILMDTGVVPFNRFGVMESWVSLAIAGLYMIAAFILKTSSIDRVSTKVQLRLVEADEKPPEPAGVMPSAPDWCHPLVESAGLAMYAVDAQGVVTHWNAAAEVLTGWTRHELAGRELPFDPHGPLLGKDGSFIEAAIWTSHIHSPHGQPRGIVVIAAGKNALKQAGLEFERSPKQRLATHR